MHLRKRILVAGGAGFLGSHLCDRLLEQGHDVICVDNLFTGTKDNIRHQIGNPNFEFVRHSIIDPIVIECDEIYNLACPASPIHYQRDPISTLKASVFGTLNLLDLALHTQARLFHASTSEIYGDPEVHPQVEGYRGNVDTTGPRACYDEGKRAAETACFDYNRMHGTPVKVVRIFNTYGPRMHPRDGRVVSTFIVQALMGKSLTIFGDGSQTRSFCYRDDLVDGFLRFMASPEDVTGPMNLGNPHEVSVGELAETVRDMTGANVDIVYRPLPVHDPKRRRPDIAQAKDKLGWEPNTPLKDGLAATIEYFDTMIKSHPSAREALDALYAPKGPVGSSAASLSASEAQPASATA